MAGAGEPEQVLGAWQAGHVQRRDLYGAVRATMAAAARRGLARVTREWADEQDVEDVVFDAFCEFEKKDPCDIQSLLGMAGRIAYLRGMDRGAEIIRTRIRERRLTNDASYRAELEFTELDAVLAERRAEAGQTLRDCLQTLPPDQRSVIENTVMRPGSLSDWAFAHDKTHQAAGQQRARALRALRRCAAERRREQEVGKEETT